MTMTLLDDFSKRVMEYDERRFLAAAETALDEWLTNDRYRQRFENSEAPRELETFDDVIELPVVDMYEFKQHPRELVVDPDRVVESLALYSSGTTSDTKSFAPRSPERTDRQKRVFRSFADELFPEFDYAAVLVPDAETLASLPQEQSRRAVFRYARWVFEDCECDYYLDVLPDAGPAPRFEDLLDAVAVRDDDVVIFGLPAVIDMLAETVIHSDQSVDLGANGAILTGGGWKGVDRELVEFRERLAAAFDIRPREHVDIYAATELSFGAGNAYRRDDPGLKRLPAQTFCYVADEERFLADGVLEPVENGTAGLMVVVDPLNTDYPGVVLTDDIVRKTGGQYGEDVRIEYVERFTK